MFKINIKQLFLLIFVGIIATSCDNDSNPAAPNVHIDADGFILESDGIEMYREFQGAILVNNLNLTTTNILELSVHFLDHDGDEIEHEDEEGEEDELASQITDSNIISILMEEHDDDHDEEEHHESGFELVGLTSGTTTFTISLMHNDHPDYTSLPISVTVAE